jgi:holo-[acyl-carrier protein] synthase
MAREMHDGRTNSPPFSGAGSPTGGGPGERSALALQLHDALGRLAALAAPGTVAGIGVDLVEIATFDALPFAEHTDFYALTFTPDEIAYCRRQAASAQHFAARFAAKEAVVKACGALLALSPAQVEIVRASTGAPDVRIHGAPTLDGLALYVSLGHSETIAYAVALAVRRHEPAAGDAV